MFFSLGFFHMVFMPPLLLVLSGMSLFTFKQLLIAVTNTARAAPSNQVVQLIHPALKHFSNVVVTIFGKPETLKFNIQHCLLMTIVLVLLAIAASTYNTSVSVTKEDKGRARAT